MPYRKASVGPGTTKTPPAFCLSRSGPESGCFRLVQSRAIPSSAGPLAYPAPYETTPPLRDETDGECLLAPVAAWSSISVEPSPCLSKVFPFAGKTRDSFRNVITDIPMQDRPPSWLMSALTWTEQEETV